MRTVRGPTRLSLSCRCKRKLTTMRCLAGVPLAASRDVNLIGLAWVLPGLLLPLVLAKVFAMFSDPYKVFFLSSAVMMALHPDLVQTDRFEKDGHPLQSELAAHVQRYRWIHEATDRGVYGDPTYGSAEKGERFISAAIEVLVRVVADIRAGRL